MTENAHSDLAESQQSFSRELTVLCDGTFLGSIQKLIYPLGAGRSLLRQSRKVQQLFRELDDCCNQSCSHENPKNVQGSRTGRSIECAKYTGDCKHVVKLQEFLNRYLSDDLVNAYVHGSLATNEEVNYSDFDALLVFGNSVFSDPDKLAIVAKKVIGATSILKEYDPLQHHGFFVLCETDLKSYPEWVFPLELFNYSKSLLHSNRSLTISNVTDSNWPIIQLANIVKSIRRRLDTKEKITNLYGLKSFLSHIMLAPCLILQAEGRSTFKRESFGLVRQRFSEKAWKSVEIATEIRRVWPPHRRRWINRLAKTLGNPHIPTTYEKKIGSSIPRSIQSLLSNDFFECTSQFVDAVQSMIEDIQSE